MHILWQYDDRLEKLTLLKNKNKKRSDEDEKEKRDRKNLQIFIYTSYHKYAAMEKEMC